MVAMRDIRELSDRIAREFKPQRIILFGSHARGDAEDDSDVDLLVVMPYRGHPARKASEIRHRIRAAFPLDLLVRSPAELEWRVEQHDWFLRELLSEGKVLYEASDG